MGSRTRWVLAGVVAAAMLGGCANDNIYSADALEEAVVASQEDLEGVTVGEATCPDDVVLEEGVQVDCTLDLEGTAAPYSVTLTDVESQDVSIAVEPVQTVIPVADTEQYVTDNLEEALAGADVTCADDAAIVLADEGDTITCTVGLGSETREVTLEVVDSAGTVEIVD